MQETPDSVQQSLSRFDIVLPQRCSPSPFWLRIIDDFSEPTAEVRNNGVWWSYRMHKLELVK
jgi:hypothetical protein